MSVEYNQYIKDHCENLLEGFNWIIHNIGEEQIVSFLPDFSLTEASYNIYSHDASKWEQEYAPYDNYFYGDKNDPEVIREFNYAWLHHIHNNPHHWQHWVLLEDDPETKDRYKALDIPGNYIVEMICDWWSFSWSKYKEGQGVARLYEIFNWYDKHEDIIIFSKSTREKVEKFLSVLKKALKENEVYMY